MLNHSAKIDTIIIALVLASIILLPLAVQESLITFINNVEHLNLTAAALGILSTLNIYFFIGLTLLVIAVVLSFESSSRLLRLLPALLLMLYLVGYPLMMSSYPPYLPDGTLYSTESLAMSLFGYQSIKGWLYDGGVYPLAFTWNAYVSSIMGVAPIHLSSIYGLLEPTALTLVAYIIARRVTRDDRFVTLAILIYMALIWSYQFHFSPQDFNIVILMLAAPLIPMAIRGDLRSIVIISLVAIALTLGHPTEDPILLATLTALLLLQLLAKGSGYKLITFNVALVTGISFLEYSSYMIPLNISIISMVFSQYSIERVIELIIGHIGHAVYFALASTQGIYPLRSMVYSYELHGGYAVALAELTLAAALYIFIMAKGGNEYRRTYVSLATGGLVVMALITLALGTYSNRLAIYVAPALSGLLAPYLSRAFNRRWLGTLTIIALAILGFIGLIFSASTIYWDYSAGNPITYDSFNTIYSLGYHFNVGSYYCTNWLTYYQFIDYLRNINTTKSLSYLGSLFDYNKNDLFYLANDESLLNYQNVLHSMMSSTITYNDGINAFSVT